MKFFARRKSLDSTCTTRVRFFSCENIFPDALVATCARNCLRYLMRICIFALSLGYSSCHQMSLYAVLFGAFYKASEWILLICLCVLYCLRSLVMHTYAGKTLEEFTDSTGCGRGCEGGTIRVSRPFSTSTVNFCMYVSV